MNKKDEEILILELFRKGYNGFPKGTILKSESPDFILKISPKKSIGIEITRLHDGSLPKNNPGFPVADLSIENLETTILKKEEMIPFYLKKNLHELWLIIATDYLKMPTGTQFSEIIPAQQFNTGFDRVFLFDLFEKKIFELTTWN